MANQPQFIVEQQSLAWDHNDRLRALGDRVHRSLENTAEIVRCTKLLPDRAGRLKEESPQILVETVKNRREAVLSALAPWGLPEYNRTPLESAPWTLKITQFDLVGVPFFPLSARRPLFEYVEELIFFGSVFPVDCDIGRRAENSVICRSRAVSPHGGVAPNRAETCVSAVSPHRTISPHR